MFSTNQLQIMKPLVAQMRDRGYNNYLAVQNVFSSDYYDYDMFIYFGN